MFFGNEGEGLTEGIQSTNNALKTIALLGEKPEYLTDIRDAQLKLCGSKEIFNDKSIDLYRDLLSQGMVLLENIAMLDAMLHEGSHAYFRELEPWIMRVKNAFVSYEGGKKITAPFIYQGHQRLAGFDRAYDIGYQGKEWFEGPSQNSIAEEVHTYYTTDCQQAFEWISLYLQEKGTLEPEVVSYIGENWKFRIYFMYPMYNLKDIYFGMKLYDFYEIPYDKAKLNNFLTGYFMATAVLSDKKE